MRTVDHKAVADHHGGRRTRPATRIATVAAVAAAALIGASTLVGCECPEEHLAGLYVDMQIGLGGGNYHFEFDVPGQRVTMELVGTLVTGCTPSCTGMSGELRWAVSVEGFDRVLAVFENVQQGGGPATVTARGTKAGVSVLDQTFTPTYFPAGCRDEQRRAEVFLTVE